MGAAIARRFPKGLLVRKEAAREAFPDDGDRRRILIVVRGGVAALEQPDAQGLEEVGTTVTSETTGFNSPGASAWPSMVKVSASPWRSGGSESV